MRKILTGISLAFSIVAFAGCGAVENAVDCHTICTRYQSCFDKNYDEGSCETRCKNDANTDSNYQHDVNVCNACITDQDCTSAAFKCGSSCTNVVP